MDGNKSAAVPLTLFGRELLTLRQRYNISQSKLGRKVGIDHSNFSKYESSYSKIARIPTRRTVEGICKALDLDEISRDRLMLAAGYASSEQRAVVLLPDLRPLNIFLTDKSVSQRKKTHVLRAIDSMLEAVKE